MTTTLLLLLAAGAAFSFLWLTLLRDRLEIPIWFAAIAALLHTVYGVLCVKAFAIIEGFGDLSVVGNMSLFGAVYFMPFAYYAGAKIGKRSVSAVFDIFTPCLVFTLLCARINCILSGCCLGRFISGATGARWPTRELEILFYMILLIYICRKIWKKESSGEIFVIYMITYGAFRFLEEGFRASDSPLGLIHKGHIWAFLTFSFGISFFAEMNRKKKLRIKEHKKYRR